MMDKTAFVIDSDGSMSWRNPWAALQKVGYNVKLFTTKEDALAALGYDAASGAIKGELPSVIITEHTELDIFRILKDKGVGLVMVGNPGKEALVKRAGGESAVVIDKLSFLSGDPTEMLVRKVNQAAKNAMLEKLNLMPQADRNAVLLGR